MLRYQAVALAPQSADARFKYGVFHQKLNHFSQTRKGYEEALTLRRQLAQSNPQPYLPAVADSLAALSMLNKYEGKPSQAKPLFQEAIAIWQTFEAKYPSPFAEKIKISQSLLNPLSPASVLTPIEI